MRTILILQIIIYSSSILLGEIVPIDDKIEGNKNVPEDIRKLFHDIRTGGYEAEKRVVPKWSRAKDPDSIIRILDSCPPNSRSWMIGKKIIRLLPIASQVKVSKLLDYLNANTDPKRQVQILGAMCFWEIYDTRIVSAFIQKLNDHRVYRPAEGEIDAGIISNYAMGMFPDYLESMKFINHDRELEISAMPREQKYQVIKEILLKHKVVDKSVFDEVEAKEREQKKEEAHQNT